MNAVFDNIVWHTLCGPHAAYAAGSGDVRRYAQGFVPFVAFRDLLHPDFSQLAPYVESGEPLYCDGWDGSAPAGWRIDAESTLCRMLWQAGMPAASPVCAVRLGAQHAAAALVLTTLTSPGPFSLRMFGLGEYIGIFDGVQLVAMAGLRLCAGGFGEITGVCTHPAFRSRGLARQLVATLVRCRMQRNGRCFLRVMRENADACRFYRRMGFCNYRESVARVFARC